MKLSIIIPVYNEEATLEKVIDQVKKVNLKRIKKEIIVVDDGSTDSTPKIIRKTNGIKRLSHKKNLGKGAAVINGISASKGDLVLIQDADLEYDPSYYPSLIEPIIQGRAKVVYGSRLRNLPLKLYGESKTPLPFHFLGNKILTKLTNLIYQSSITDMETCYKVFLREVLEDITLNARGFELEPEITAKVLKNGHDIYEVDIKVIPRGYDEGKKITWRDGIIAVKTLVKYRIRE